MDSYFANVVLLALNDNAADGTTTFVDSSNSAHTITGHGGIAYTNASAPTGMTTSGHFIAASSHYLSLAAHADFNFGAGDFTLEFNYYSTALGPTQEFYTTETVGLSGVQLYNNGVDSIAVAASNNGSTWNVLSNGAIYTNAAVFGQWNHFALTQASGVVRGFFNGTKIHEVTAGGAFKDASVVNIGSFAGFAGFFFNGWMSNIRITKGVARYTANFTPESLPYADAAHYTTDGGALGAGAVTEVFNTEVRPVISGGGTSDGAVTDEFTAHVAAEGGALVGGTAVPARGNALEGIFPAFTASFDVQILPISPVAMTMPSLTAAFTALNASTGRLTASTPVLRAAFTGGPYTFAATLPHIAAAFTGLSSTVATLQLRAPPLRASFSASVTTLYALALRMPRFAFSATALAGRSGALVLHAPSVRAQFTAHAGISGALDADFLTPTASFGAVQRISATFNLVMPRLR